MQIYTNSKEDLPYALDRRNDKEIALDALRTTEERREALAQTRGREIERSHDRGYSRPRDSLNTAAKPMYPTERSNQR
jgi:hypothetical protein